MGQLFFSEHVFYKKCIDRQVKQDKVLFFLQKLLTLFDAINFKFMFI
jgi:hypothetical protein